MPLAGGNFVLAGDWPHGMDCEAAPASVLPGIGLDMRFTAENVSGSLDTVLPLEKFAQFIAVRFTNCEIEEAHVVHSNAVSIRLIMVQMPSTPGRHSLLCRDHRCHRCP